MEKCILVRYGELFLKGKNKGYFEKTLFKNLKTSLSGVECNIYKIAGRLVINKYDDVNENQILGLASKVFGISSLSPATSIGTSLENIKAFVGDIMLPENSTFKVDVNRADKTFVLNSIELARLLGGVVLATNPTCSVNLSSPQNVVYVDVRENCETFIYDKVVKGSGGMPVSTSGTATLMLSGGIDSPVAGYLMAKRGLTLYAVHFHSFPYTSLQAKQKVVDLAKILSQYTGSIKLFVVPFTKIQEEINRNCKNEYLITIMRRIMMRIAEQISIKNNSGAIITGESLAQVASQTMQSITTTDSVVTTLPVFRPLISFDKEDIIKISKNINTYDTSILPYEDCCTIFLPAHPVIKPTVHAAQREEAKLDLEWLIQDAIDGVEEMLIN